jgi:hypothetical protein
MSEQSNKVIRLQEVIEEERKVGLDLREKLLKYEIDGPVQEVKKVDTSNDIKDK